MTRSCDGPGGWRAPGWRRWAWPLALAGGLVAAGRLARDAEPGPAAAVVVEDWTGAPVGTRGVPPGWQVPAFARATARLTLVERDGRRALHLLSRDDSATIGKALAGRVDLRQTPILEWTWRAVVLPAGGDSRRAATDDQAGQVFVVWPRSPEPLRSRLIGYVWDTTAPAGLVAPSEKTRTVTYVVVRSGPAELDRWITERRDIAADYRRLFGEAPPAPGAVALAIDSNDTHSVAEAYLGTIRFTAP